MKDHKIAQLYNTLRDTAIKYGSAGQLRARLAKVVAPVIPKLTEEELRRVKENLCSYDPKNPYYDEELEGDKPDKCYCHSCFYGNRWMAELILKLIGEE